MNELQRIDPAALRRDALPGWRLHALRDSNQISISVDMNFRALAKLDGRRLILHRVVKHDTADRADINRNDQSDPLADVATGQLGPEDVYDALRLFGVAEAEAAVFRDCQSEDDLLNSASRVSEATANLALTLYDTSGLVIPQARFRVLQKDEDLARVLDDCGDDWQMFLHPSQGFIVELPPGFRAAVVGSAGTGKTVCAWHRSKHLIERGISVGFVCPHQSVLDVSKKRLDDMVGAGDDRSYFFVPNQPDELLQLAEAVDHLIIDEAQEIPVTWYEKLGEKIPESVGVTLFYDINQLGGNIPNGDTVRYRRRISDWKVMLGRFPRLQKFSLNINYRNAREIAEYYLGLLTNALPMKPSADVPTFETGEVVRRQVRNEDLVNVLASLLLRLLGEYVPGRIGVVSLDRGPNALRRGLADRKLPVAEDPSLDTVVVTTASKIRGHEREVMIVTMKGADALQRNFGAAIDAYVAMSRAVKRLFVIEVA